MAVQRFCKPKVGGSTPSAGTINKVEILADKTDRTFVRTMEIMQAVDQDNEILIRCAETLKPIVYDKEYLSRFQNTYSAHIANYMQRAFHRDGISCICRMWDQDKDALSIPNLVREIQKENVLDKFRLRRRSAMTDILETPTAAKIHKEYGDAGRQSLEAIAQRDGDRAESKLSIEIQTIAELVKSDELKDLLIKARNWRHKYIAHSLRGRFERG